MEILSVVAVLALCAALFWLGFRVEPHWVSKDARRFVCNGQLLNARGEPQSRWRETRIVVGDDNELHVGQKKYLRRKETSWTVSSRSEAPPRNREIFLLSGVDEDGLPALLALRLPKSSRAIPTIQGLLTRTRGVRPSSPDRGTG